MATIPMLSDSGPARLRTMWRWAAPLAALGLVFAIGGGIGFAHQAVLDYKDVLSSALLERWAQGGIGPLSQAALLLTLLLVWRIGRKAALFGAFLFVERGLAGPPVDKEAFRFALAVQLAILVLYAVAATLLLVFAPFPAMPEPVLNLGQADVASWLGPLAPVAIALAALLVYDFFDYWVHRALHRFAFLWRFHSMHHSVEHLDSLNSYSHPVDLASSTIVFIIVSLVIGFTFETMLLFLAFQTVHERLLHTRAPINFGVLGAVLVDNRTHFLHHDRVEARSGKNFAGTLTIFDRLFGTYQRPDARVLAATGLEDQRPPATVADFFLGRPGGRQAGGQSTDCPRRRLSHSVSLSAR
jgi:sterol desaturase/sphingolipid hydroxylase (fatty acid hydroxylase superfamily)